MAGGGVGVPRGGGFGAGRRLVNGIGVVEPGFLFRIGFGRIGFPVFIVGRGGGGEEGLLGIGDHFGDVIGARRKGGLPAPAFGQFARIGSAGQDVAQQFVEPRGGGAAARAGGVVGIEPGDMREQQPAVEPGALAHRLAPVVDRFGNAVQRAVGQHLLHMLPREHERRLPPLRKGGIAAAVDIGRLRRQADGGAGDPRVAVAGEVAEEGNLPFGGEIVAGKAGV